MNGGRRRFLDAASRIGRRLCRDAVWSEGRCNWLGWAMEPHGGQWVTRHRPWASRSTTAPRESDCFSRASRISRRPDRRDNGYGRDGASADRRR